VVQLPFQKAVDPMAGHIAFAKIDREATGWSFLESPAWQQVDRIAMEYHLWRGHTAQDAETLLRLQ
jgi:hypothetical protein